MEQVCGNCREMLSGAYCHGCGQKRLSDGDRRLGHLLGQFFAAATDLDGRFWRSLRALMLQPGRLSRDYLDGRRRYWLAPMSLFLLANVLYFLSPRTLTDFNLPLADQIDSQVHSSLTRPLVEARVAQRDAAARARWRKLAPERRTDAVAGYTMADYARAYDAQAGNVGKALIVVHIPFIALGLLLMFRRRRMYFAEHLVVATHLFTFTLMYIQFVLLPLEWVIGRIGIGDRSVVTAIVVGTFVLMGGYYDRAVHRVYAPRRWVSLLAPFVLITAMMAGNIYVYRALQFVLTYWLS